MTELAPTLQSLWLATATHLWQTTLVLLPLFLLARLMRSAPARLQNALWWTAFAKLLLPVALLGRCGRGLGRLLLPGGIPDGLAGASSRGLGLAAALWNPTILGARAGGAAAAPVSPWLGALSLVWLAGASWILFRWGRHVLADARRRSVPLESAPEWVRERLEEAMRGTRISPRLVRIPEDGRMPSVAGLVHPRILLPLHLLRILDPAALRGILLHEDAHRRRREPFLAALQSITLAVFFFYPLLWPIVRRLHDTAELACDESAVAQGVGRETYRRALARTLASCLGSPSPAVVAAAGRRPSLLRLRFERLVEPGRIVTMKKHRLTLGVGILLVVSGSLVPITPLAGSPGPSSEPRMRIELERLDGHEVPVTMSFTDRPANEVLEAIGRVAGFEVAFEGDPPTISVETDKLTAARALTLIAEQAAVRYEVRSPRLLLATFLRPADADVPSLAGIDGVTNPERIAASYVPPVYPEEARRTGTEGKVLLQAVIRTDGTVSDVKVLKAVDDVPAFTENAIAAVKRWRYRPARKDGEPVAVYVTIIVDFKLDGPRVPAGKRSDS